MIEKLFARGAARAGQDFVIDNDGNFCQASGFNGPIDGGPSGPHEMRGLDTDDDVAVMRYGIRCLGRVHVVDVAFSTRTYHPGAHNVDQGENAGAGVGYDGSPKIVEGAPSASAG